MSALLVGALLVINLSACSPAPSQSSSAEQALDDLIAESWQYRLQTSPMSAVYMGQPEAIGLDDMSELTLVARQFSFKEFLQQANAIDESDLPSERQVDLAILRYQLADNYHYYKFKRHFVPIMAESGFHNDVVNHLQHRQLRNEQQISDYLDTLGQIPRYFEQQIGWLEKGLESGNTQPQVVLKGFEHSIAAYQVDNPADHALFKPLQQLPSWLNEQQRQQAQQQALTLIEQQVMPAFDQLYQFFVERYIPGARTTIAIADTENGEAFYANRVRHFTTRDLTVEQVHQLGLQEVARIREQMEAVIEEVAFDGDFAAFLQFLRTDPQFYATTPKQLLQQAAYIAKKADAQLPRFFHHLPRTPYGVEPVPASIAPKYTTGRYVSPRSDTDSGTYWVNTHSLDKRPLYVLEALTLHEAVPGHHLQIALNNEMTHLSPFRTYSYISAFGEGWGLYAEWLGLEMGFYQTPYDNFGRLSYEMWRALRLVVDTGIHAKGWTRQQAIDFMAQNSALSLHNITTEVDRYISWPGQALSYKVGEITIRQLRQQAEQQLGAEFDIREFHHQILRHGSVPLSALEQQIASYIERTLAAKESSQ
ncbi:DUF885 domain-containing protein [Neiella sp. HB171785]|uniref:DUF885 domain-containing protein n=1 Tax=Neiella litorisoli TaxID=2771431 RepID=A0A8J6QH53_9GAMM|nr:DUF885 domain-containing protein [Neiella litorisoli]MBD1388377.1 DUF885 domain-containing protein [Neiella litorisoli]